MKLRNLGKKTYDEIVSYVESYGLTFGTDVKQYGLLTTSEKIRMEDEKEKPG